MFQVHLNIQKDGDNYSSDDLDLGSNLHRSPQQPSFKKALHIRWSTSASVSSSATSTLERKDLKSLFPFVSVTPKHKSNKQSSRFQPFHGHTAQQGSRSSCVGLLLSRYGSTLPLLPSCFFLNMAKPRMFWYSNIFPNCNALDHSATVPLQSKLATFSTTEQFRTLQGYNLIQAYLKWLLFLAMTLFCYLYLSTAHVRVLHAQLCPMGFRQKASRLITLSASKVLSVLFFASSRGKKRF